MFFQCLTKLLYSLLLILLADEDCAVVFGDDIALQSL